MDKRVTVTDFSHINKQGEATMVDVSQKSVTERHARARGSVIVRMSTLDAIANNQIAKGDVISTARIAGIMAAKRCDELIPLCHSVPLDDAQVNIRLCHETASVEIDSAVSCHGRTGVEMEALLAVSIAALTIYDMVKAIDRTAVISDVCLTEKSGGKSGHFVREDKTCREE